MPTIGNETASGPLPKPEDLCLNSEYMVEGRRELIPKSWARQTHTRTECNLEKQMQEQSKGSERLPCGSVLQPTGFKNKQLLKALPDVRFRNKC